MSLDSVLKIKNKHLYLDPTHNFILGMGESGADLDLFLNSSSYTTDYTVVGSPTITSDYVLRNISPENYLSKSFGSTSYTTSEVNLKVMKYIDMDDNLFWGSSANFHLKFKGDGKIQIWDSGVGSTTGSKVYKNNVPICVKLTQNGSTIKVYCLVGDFTQDNIPPLTDSRWSLEITRTYSVNIFSNATMYIGVNGTYTAQFFNGCVFLEDCSVKTDNSLLWSALTTTTYNKISASLLNPWTCLGNSVVYLTGSKRSSLTSSMWSADTIDTGTLKGYIVYDKSRGSLQFLSSTAYTSNQLYLGYSVVFADSTGLSITSMSKTGTLCRIFKHTTGITKNYVIAPIEDLDEDAEFSVGDLKEYTSTGNDLPLTNATVSTLAYTYSASTPDKIIDSNDIEYTSIGEYFIEWGA